MRRHLVTLALAATATALAGALLSGAPAGAQTGCTGDLVSASIEVPSLPGGAWSVTDACVDARDFFTDSFEDTYPFAVGISQVTYDDGHVGRLAFLAVRIAEGNTVTVVGMEDAATGELRFAGTTQTASVTAGGASVAGDGISFPPLELATVSLSFTDTAADLPDWATTTTTPTPTLPPEMTPDTSVVAPTTVPDGAPTTVAPTTSVVPETTVPPTTTIPA